MGESEKEYAHGDRLTIAEKEPTAYSTVSPSHPFQPASSSPAASASAAAAAAAALGLAEALPSRPEVASPSRPVAAVAVAGARGPAGRRAAASAAPPVSALAAWRSHPARVALARHAAPRTEPAGRHAAARVVRVLRLAGPPVALRRDSGAAQPEPGSMVLEVPQAAWAGEPASRAIPPAARAARSCASMAGRPGPPRPAPAPARPAARSHAAAGQPLARPSPTPDATGQSRAPRRRRALAASRWASLAREGCRASADQRAVQGVPSLPTRVRQTARGAAAAQSSPRPAVARLPEEARPLVHATERRGSSPLE